MVESIILHKICLCNDLVVGISMMFGDNVVPFPSASHKIPSHTSVHSHCCLFQSRRSKNIDGNLVILLEGNDLSRPKSVR